jgi:hypothetical protein
MGHRTLVLGERKRQILGRERKDRFSGKRKTTLHPFRVGVGERVDYGLEKCCLNFALKITR